MKKSLLLFATAVAGLTSAQAQTRLSLYEEFSGENCGPCATYNPKLWELADNNSSKVMLIKYQSPIPSAGPIYNLYKTVTDARLAYYAIGSAPNGNLNGKDVTGHVANLTQAAINTTSASGSPFTLTVSHSYNATLDSVTATISITATKAYSGTSIKLRVALIEDLKYAKMPGNNGELDFHHVVREMYPDATGTTIANSWTASQTQSITIKGKVPTYVDKGDANIVVWIQNDGDKFIPQAAKSTYVPLSRDADISEAKTALVCGTTGTTAKSVFVLRNAGSTPITTAKIFYRPDGGTWASMNWTGNLAAGAKTTVTTPGVTVSISNSGIMDSVGEVNGSADVNRLNDARMSNLTFISATTVPIPYATNFETSGFPANYIAHDPDNTGFRWINGTSTTGLARAGSMNMPWFRVSSFPAGTVAYLMMPNPAAATKRTLEFWHAYAQTNTSSTDKLEVVYSTDCGLNWTSIWSKTGAALATGGPSATAGWLPSPAAATTDWKKNSVSLNTVPSAAIFAFRGTAGGGSNLFLDDVAMLNVGVGVNETILENSVSVYPNPARGAAKLHLGLTKSGEVSINVMDATGRIVSVVHNGTLAAGNQELDINTDRLASGLYKITIRAADGVYTQPLSVVK